MEPTLRSGADRLAFQHSSQQLLRDLLSDCSVADFTLPDQPAEDFVPFKALWDTGATNSVITDQVVQQCNLIPSGKTFVYGVNGRHLADTYLITIQLQGLILFPSLRVTMGDFLGADVLVGMDIITHGDFFVTNQNGQTTFAFRVPSQGGLNFIASDHEQDE